MKVSSLVLLSNDAGDGSYIQPVRRTGATADLPARSRADYHLLQHFRLTDSQSTD
jgi:hypothetical protein